MQEWHTLQVRDQIPPQQHLFSLIHLPLQGLPISPPGQVHLRDNPLEYRSSYPLRHRQEPL